MMVEVEMAEAEKRLVAMEEHDAKVVELQANIETLRAVGWVFAQFFPLEAFF